MNPTGGPQVNIKTNIDATEATKQITELMRTASRSIGDMGKAVDRYNRTLNKTLSDLEGVTRAGSNAGQAIRDLSLAGGGSVAGRVRQANQRAQKSAIAQTQEVLTADLVNFQAQIFDKVAKSTKAALVSNLARQKQELASIDAEIRAAQIQAQRARVGFASQLHGTRGNVRDTITDSANALGVRGIGTLRSEQAALDKLLAAEQNFKLEASKANKELRDQEQYLGRIARLTDQKTEPLRRQIEILQKQNAIERENLRLQQAQQTGNQSQVIKSRLKQEALRMDQMALRGVREESAEYQNQIQKVRALSLEQQKLNAEKLKGAQTTREAAALERSRQFAAGVGTQSEIARNQMVGGRRNAASIEGRASLLGMQGNLLMNYGLLGGGVAAIAGTTAAVVELDAKLRELQAIAGATNGEFNALREVVIKTSEDTKFSAVELAEASVMLAQVGQSTNEIKNTLPVISAFAMAVGTDMKNAVDIVTTSLTVFNMNSNQTQRVTNVLTEALNRSKLSMDQLVLGFQYSANIAADAGVTFEELTAVLAGMSQAGIRSGSMLGTGLRQILMSLANPTEQVTALIAQLGLTMNDVDVKTQGLTGVLSNLAGAGLTAAQAMSAFETRTAAALVAASNQVDFIRQVQEQFTFTRAAEEAAAKQSESFKNSMLELKNEFLSFMNDAARPILELFIGIAKGVKAAGNAIGPLVPLLKATATAMMVVFGAAAIASVAKLGVAFLSFSGITTAATGAMATFSQVGNMVALSMTAQVGAAARLRLALTALQASVPPLLIIGVLAAAIVGFGMALKNGTDSAKQFKERLDEQKTKMNEAQAATDSYMQVLSQLDDTIARVRDRAAKLKDGSNELRLEIMQGASTFNEYGAGIDSTNVKLDDYIAKLQGARAGVIALAEAQAAESYKEAQGIVNTERGNLRNNLGMVRARAGNTIIDRELASLGLSATDLKTLMDALKVLREADATTTNTGTLSNIANAGSNVNRILGGYAQYKGLAVSAQNTGFAAGSLNAALSNQATTGDTARGLALLQSPQFMRAAAQLGRIVEGFEDIEPAIDALTKRAQSGEISNGEFIQQRQLLVSQYSERYKTGNRQLEAANRAFDAANPSGAERFAYDKTMEPITERAVRLRSVLLEQQTQLDNMLKEAIEVITAQIDAPEIMFDDILANARKLGLIVPNNIQDRGALGRHLAIKQSEIARGASLANVLGNVQPFQRDLAAVERQTITSGKRQDNSAMVELIREKAKAAGLDPDVMVRIARIETAGTFNPAIKNPKSTATGLYQFMAPTWNALHPDMAVSTRIDSNDPNDPRKNASLNAETAMQEMGRLVRMLTQALGRAPEGWEMYMAWQQGGAGAKALLGADQNMNAIDALTPAYNGNRSRARAAILQNGGQEGWTAGQFNNNWRSKYAASGQGGVGESPRNAEEQLREAANQARRQMEATADGAKTIATTARNLATRTIRNINEFMTDDQAETTAVTISDALKQVNEQTNRYYDLKITALKNYRDRLFNAGQMTQDQSDELSQQLADLESARDNELDRVQEDTISTLTKMYRELPNSVGKIDNAFKTISQVLDDLAEQAANSAEQMEVDYQSARGRIAGEVDDRRVAFGSLSQAEADARATMRGVDARNAAEALQPRLLATAMTRAGAATGALDTSFGSFGLNMRGITSERLRTEQATLAGMDPKASTLEYARQQALVQSIQDNLGKANELRKEERDLLLEINALSEAMSDSQLNFGQRISNIMQGWGESQGTFKSLTNDVLNSVPGMLDAVSGSFATFFSDVMSGTASVGDAFRAMASSILKSMMDVVASAAAKQLMRLVLQLGMSLFGGTTGPNTNPAADLAGLYKDGGVIRAAGGYGPVRGRDSVLINAMPGEVVMRKSAVDAVGAENLLALNAAGNRLTSGAAAPQAVSIAAPQAQERPMSIYVVSPDKVPPPSRDNIVAWVQEDMVNRGAIWKTTKAIQQGAV